MNESYEKRNAPAGPAAPVYSAPAPSGYPAYGIGGSPYGEGSPADTGPLHALDPMRLLQIARKKWLTILLALVFALSAAGFYLSQSTPVYQALATIELSVRRPRILNKQEAQIEDPATIMQFTDIINTRIEKLKGPSIIPHALASYRDLYPDDPAPDGDLEELLSGGTGFSLMRRTLLVQVSFSSTNRAFALRACNAFAAGAEASARAENRAASDAAVAWLEAQAEAQKAVLESADRAHQEVRQQYQMQVLEGQQQTVRAALIKFNESLVQLETMAAREQKILDALESMELAPETAGNLPADIPRAAEIEVTINRWRAAMTDRESLLTRYTRNHPAVEAQDNAVALYREEALAALRRAKETTAANLALYADQADGIREKIEEQVQRANNLEQSIVSGETHITSLERARSAADSSYLGILFRIQEARLSADENTATVQQVEPARRARQIHPRPVRSLFMALVMGFLGGFVLAFLAETLEDHVVGMSDIEAGTGVKILAVIPHVKAQDRRVIATATLTHKFSELAEAFSGLRSVLDSPAYRDRTQVILVASSLPEEGKTTTCCNLATACALNGQRTLLIDFDLRRPRIGEVFPRPNGSRGLTEYLVDDRLTPGDIVYPTECRNLSVMASRASSKARPAELVGGGRVGVLLEWARARFDRIIIDVPPLGLVSDALSLSSHADCVLVMARPAASRKRAVRHTIRRFHDVGVSALAVVMNDVDHSKFAYHGYGPYYHYRKHYSSYAEPAPAATAGGSETPSI